ncbi:pH-response regulator protein palC [Acrodontium crateriforme]|uniref:pH-response regulator protein palC n=1 Tax=Acrodontium crateriforme TaxID=150365 RepID=A0AAQ3LZK5_9PEZI|nr:pH-response regulator protein palC [Acrodontium crateriforme]
MPFAFTLPTTSSVLLSDYFDSATHPSLPLTATTKRSVLKDALKKHKRLAPRDRAAHLPAVHNALNNYIPYLLAINTASGFRDVGPERIDLTIIKPLEVEWRTTLSTPSPGREAPRQKLTGIHYEVAFTLSTLGYVQMLLARSQLRSIFDSTRALSAEQRTAAITGAMKHLLEANSIHNYLLSLLNLSGSKDTPADIQPSTVSALASLALAEATLIVVLKDDPYAAAVTDDRNASNTDWMFKAPSIPKVRAHLYARISLAAADYASEAQGLLSKSGASTGRLDNDLIKYATDLRRTSRGKAARFLAIDADLSGKTGDALAWLKGARRELGIPIDTEEGKPKGFRGLKQSWHERREDKKVETSGEWGMDAGKLDEIRVVEMLEAKWDRENSTVNVQLVPPYEPLLASMPSGREYHTTQPYTPPSLDASALALMRAPPEPDERAFRGEEDDSGKEDQFQGRSAPGAFPGSGAEYGRSATSNSYY